MNAPLVLVHGLSRDVRDWDGVIARLPDRRCHALPIAGMAGQDPAADGAYSIEAHAARLAASVAAICAEEGPVHLVGNSLGGLLAAIVAAALPAAVERLTLVAPALPLSRLPYDGQWGILALAAPGAEALLRADRSRPLRARVEDLARLTLADPDSASPHVLRVLEAGLLRADASPTADHALLQTTRSLVGSLFAPSRTARLLAALGPSPVDVEALYGWHDRLVPRSHAPRLRAALPAARVTVLPWAGHLIQLEHPADVAAAINAPIEPRGGGRVRTHRQV